MSGMRGGGGPDMKLAGWVLICVSAAPGLGQGTPQELEGMGDISMAQGQHELAKAYYKQALMADPRDEALWLKLERAMEAYHEAVFVRDGGGGLAPFTAAADA